MDKFSFIQDEINLARPEIANLQTLNFVTVVSISVTVA